MDEERPDISGKTDEAKLRAVTRSRERSKSAGFNPPGIDILYAGYNPAERKREPDDSRTEQKVSHISIGKHLR